MNGNKMVSNSSLSQAFPLVNRIDEKSKCLNNQDVSECNLNQSSKVARSNILDFYHDRSVLITGGSGFIGKVLIEKLLRTCDSIKHIYVLIRPKGSKQPSERIKELLDFPLFDIVRKKGVLHKVLVVEGDVTQHSLGLSDSNLLRIMNEVSVIFHSAATVKFDEPLKQSVSINIAGTKNMIELCRKIPQLAALVHVSTAYANCDRPEIDEYIYPVDKLCPEKLIEMANWLDQDTLQELKFKLLRARPNTYTYTKALAEWLLFECARDLPVVICRPSIVVASYKEPFSGWIDNVNGPTGIILGAGKGLIRSMIADPQCIADLVPVDTVINCIITLGWFAHVYQNHKRSNDSADSLTESLIGSSSGDESLDSFTSNLVTSADLDNGNQTKLIQNYSETNENDIHGSPDNFNSGIEDVDNYNNNNNNSNDLNSGANFHKDGYIMNLAKSKSDIRSVLINNNVETNFEHRYNSRQLSDEGYTSATQTPTPKFAKSTSSVSLNTNKPPQSNTTLTSEISTINNEQIDTNDKVLTLAAQRRLAEQKHAAFQYKLKQFRHNQQIKLAAQNLPEEIADIPVFHCTSGTQNPITWLKVQRIIMTLLAIYPSTTTYRYPNGAFTKNKCLDDFYRITLHYIPGYIFDFIKAKLLGGKPMLVRIFKKYDQASSVLMAFTTNQWKFKTGNRMALINELMSEEDRRLFDCDLTSLNWDNFLKDYVLGVRKYMLKEPIENIEQARFNLKIVYYRNLSLQVLFLAMFVYFLI